MRFFLDTANIDEIKAVNDMGVIDGVTTNPSLIAKEGKDFKEIQKNYPDEFNKMIEQGYKYTYPNGESLIDCYERVSKGIEFILNETPEDNTILICSHAGTIRNILTYLISNTFEYHWNFKIDNGSVTILEVQDGFTVITAMNNTSFI